MNFRCLLNLGLVLIVDVGRMQMAVVESFNGGIASAPMGATLRAQLVAMVTRRYPLLSGCGKLSRARLVGALAGPVSGDAWMRTAAGPLIAPLEDSIGRSILFTGDYDRKVNWIARRAVAPGDVAADVGANFGLVSTTLSRAVGPHGVVHAFEPNPAVARYLQRTLARNDMANVTLHRIGLGAEEGEFVLSAPVNNTGGGSFCAVAGAKEVARHLVAVRRFDALIDADQPIAFMKVDVEGFERAVFEGARTKFENRTIRSALFEEHRRCYATTTPETIAFFEGLDYDIYAVPRCLTRMRFVPLARARAERLDARDYLVVARGPETATLRRRLRLG